MRQGIGIDFGTSNSLAAFHDAGATAGGPIEAGTTRFVPLEVDTPVMPTATYLDRDFQVRTGQAAIDQYIDDNTGRTVELVPEVLGESSILVGAAGANSREAPETMTQKVYGPALEDPGLPGRLFRGLKRLLGDPHTRRLMVFGQPYRLVALITPVLLRIRREIERSGTLAGPLRCGHPVRFEGRDPNRQMLALERLQEACRHAGLLGSGIDFGFFPEPVAAALSWRASAAETRGTALVFDFGGGTLDLALLRFDGDDHRILATAGAAIGGDHIDQRLFRELLFPLLGKGELWRRWGDERMIETRFPFEQYEELLLNWTVGYTLNQNRFRHPVMDCMQQPPPAGPKFRRLFDLITRNLGYQLFQEVAAAKVRLSTRESTVLDLPELDIALTVERGTFEAMIEDILERIDAVVDDILQQADLAPGQVDVVVRTGGSSLIPAVARLLERRFPGRVVDHDPFGSVAEGLSIAAARGL
ncbi:MAG: Hsp70 family protein [Gammaproteobacteria bacterium]|nr:Hsp70 family protein [Gammaproteobacteria bacterium]